MSSSGRVDNLNALSIHGCDEGSPRLTGKDDIPGPIANGYGVDNQSSLQVDHTDRIRNLIDDPRF